MNNRPKTPHGFARLIIGDGSAVSEQKNIIWNMIGSFLYAFASMVLSIAVVQLAGEDAGGVFTFAFTTFGQHMFMAAYFGIRPFQGLRPLIPQVLFCIHDDQPVHRYGLASQPVK